MRITRIHTDQPLSSGQEITLEGSAANHITHVLRLRPGASLTLFNGEGGEYPATLTDTGKHNMRILVGSHADHETESPIEITLAQGISRGERMDYAIQKAVELGVSRIVPVTTERTQVTLKGERLGKKLRHWQGIAISACEQCGRNRIPPIESPISLDVWLQGLSSLPTRFSLSPTPSRGEEEKQASRPTSTFPLPPGGGQGEGDVSPKTHNPPLPGNILELARTLRRTQTDAETCLWKLLRNKQLGGFKFRRQHPQSGYILDFYNHQTRLAIELDGGGHNFPAQQLHDDTREQRLTKNGIRVLRFWNHEVLQQAEEVLEKIWDILRERTSLPPTPSRGEGEKQASRPTSTFPWVAPSTTLMRRWEKQASRPTSTFPLPPGGGQGEGRELEQRLVLSPSATSGLPELQPAASTILLIGPEGGLTDKEISQARASGFTGIRLGPRILRTETAAIATLSVIQMLWGDLG